jgi:hypothetical protein
MIKITSVMKDLLDKALADGTPCLIGPPRRTAIRRSARRAASRSLTTIRCATGSAAIARRRSGSAKIKTSWSITATRRARRIPIAPAASASTVRPGSSPAGPERDKAWDLTNHEEQSKDPDKKGAAVIIDLDLIEQIDSTVIMKKD